ncbi:hypothetical protein [Xanthomarina sp.]|uniref:hypothetical protein n=1 Tax=Xanthomarina sp. TaxID=1931211 RepID=UPI0021EF118D|nr:hypothetical protein [Xanthomarina sp.]HLV40454.1 hypothetical protein [Xanthomarina sp.]
MNHIYNNYQVSKTLRFGLTQKQKIRRPGYTGELYESHKVLKELVKISEEKVKNLIVPAKNEELLSSLDSVKWTLTEIREFLDQWRYIYNKSNQIALDKSYYLILSKKLGFNDEKKSRVIKMIEIKDDIKEKIINYWAFNLNESNQKLLMVNEMVNTQLKALEINRTDHKINEIELRKALQSLFNTVLDILKPLVYREISFINLEKIEKDSKNSLLEKFATDFQRKIDLLEKIRSLKTHFSENGGNVSFCRATFNPKTAIKNPKSNDNSILKEIKKLGIKDILENNENVFYFEKKLAEITAKEKLEYIIKDSESFLIRSLLFKYISIPAFLHHGIATELAPIISKEKNDLINFMISIGQIKSPAKDYADIPNKNDFNVNAYPIKVAFDYAWETVAKSQYHHDINAPVSMCKTFLDENFENCTKTKYFTLYSDLLELHTLLSTLDYGNPSMEDSIIDKANKIIAKIDNKEHKTKDKDLDKDIDKYKETIKNRLNHKNFNDKQRYSDAKKELSQFRGKLKNENDIYRKLTESYKKIAMNTGKIFAEMRDKISNASEQNKISHHALIIEDHNKDRYLFLQEFTTDKEKQIESICNDQAGQYIVYWVNSITSKSISKMLSKKRIEKLKQKKIINNSIKTSILSDAEKEARDIKEWVSFIKEKGWDIDFNLDLQNKNLEEIKKEVDAKAYKLKETLISQKTLSNLVKEGNCLLFPIINKDLVKKVKTEKNQFTKDWNSIFKKDNLWRLTPEFRVSYRQATPGYPTSDIGTKRYSRFQMTAHFLCDFLPQGTKYISNREQIENYKSSEKQKEAVEIFHQQIENDNNNVISTQSLNHLARHFGSKNIKKKHNTIEKKFYVFGIDRGQKELATLCIIDQDKKIEGPFKIYTRSFNTKTKQWEHQFYEERYILDISNLRVETSISIDGKPDQQKILVDLSYYKEGEKFIKLPKMQVKLQQLAYIRKLQYQMQRNPETVLDWSYKNTDDKSILENFVDKPNGEKGLVSFYGAAVIELKDTLPLSEIKDMLERFKELKGKEKNGEDVSQQLNELTQLKSVDHSKYGVVANMVGVIAHLLERYDYKAYISLEDLTKPYSAIDGITGQKTDAKSISGKQQDVEKYAGLGLYNFFEIQLLKKLFRIQKDSQNTLHLVPAFRATKNYENLIAGEDKVKNRFGIVYFVDPKSTSIMCPSCGKTNNSSNKEKRVVRDKKNGNDIIYCEFCGFDTRNDYKENPLKFIKSGDDNAAYIISTHTAKKAYELAKSIL